VQNTTARSVARDVVLTWRRYYSNSIVYPYESVSSSKWHVWHEIIAHHRRNGRCHWQSRQLQRPAICLPHTLQTIPIIPSLSLYDIPSILNFPTLVPVRYPFSAFLFSLLSLENSVFTQIPIQWRTWTSPGNTHFAPPLPRDFL